MNYSQISLGITNIIDRNMELRVFSVELKRCFKWFEQVIEVDRINQEQDWAKDTSLVYPG